MGLHITRDGLEAIFKACMARQAYGQDAHMTIRRFSCGGEEDFTTFEAAYEYWLEQKTNIRIMDAFGLIYADAWGD